MLAFGLNKKLCNDFLKKQAVIGNLDEGETVAARLGHQGSAGGGQVRGRWSPNAGMLGLRPLTPPPPAKKWRFLFFNLLGCLTSCSLWE